MATKKVKAEAVQSQLPIKAVCGWGQVSGSKATKDQVWGLKVWEGQEVKQGDLVILQNRFGQETLAVVGTFVKVVPSNRAKGEMGYALWTKQELGLNA